MPNGFKKFIATSGKSFDDIKKMINDMVIGAADNAAEKIAESVQREVRNIRRAAEQGDYKPEKILPGKANISYRSETKHVAPPPEPELHIAYPHESLPESMSPQDEYMLDKIREMRDKERITHNSYTVNRCALENLIIQGEFMADVEDDFERKAYCGISMPIYAMLSNSQLRTYFTWRTDVRRGKYSEIDKSYVVLYCFELMNKIGGISSSEAFDKLCAVWENCREFAPYLDRVIPMWIKDFYAFNHISRELPELPKYGSPAGLDLTDDFSEKLDLLAEFSAYNITGSAFLNDKTKPLINGAIEASLCALSKYFAKRGLSLLEILFGKLRSDYSWEPFSGAPVDLDRQDGFHKLKIDSTERYCVKRGKPAHECFDFAPSRGFIGYVLKSVESELRQMTGMGRRLKANISMLQNDIRNKDRVTEAVNDPEFERVIPAAVAEFCSRRGIPNRKKTASDYEECDFVRPAVEIDVSKLGKIREQSDELTKKLVISEELTEVDEDKIAAISEQISDDDFNEQTSQFARLADGRNEIPEAVKISNLPEEWNALANCLSEKHIAVLEALSQSRGAELCRELNLLPEMVYEEINTLSLEHIGDTLIDNGEIIMDYSEEVSKLIKRG